MCESGEYLKRSLVVGSNAMFLLPIIYCFRLNWRLLAPEIFYTTSVLIWSSLYHLCDNGDTCTKFCIFGWIHLYRLDFIFSYQMLPVALTYVVDPRRQLFKCIFLGV